MIIVVGYCILLSSKIYRSDTAFTTCTNNWTTGASLSLPAGNFIILRRGYNNNNQKMLFGHGYNAGEYTSTKNQDTNEFILDINIEDITSTTVARNYIFGISPNIVTNGITAIKFK